MRHVVYLFVFLSSVSCGSGGGDNNNHGYGWEYDVQGASGLTLRYDPAEPVDQRTPVAVFEDFYRDVQNCTGLAAPAPLVLVVPNPGGTAGRYYSDPPLITVTGLFVFKHEAIHYLLDHNTGNLDKAHNSELFANCS